MLDANASKISDYQGLDLCRIFHTLVSKKVFRQAVLDSGLPVVCADFHLKDGSLTADCVINDFKQAVKKVINIFLKKDLILSDIWGHTDWKRMARFTEMNVFFISGRL